MIVVGKISQTYGIKGWLKIISYTEPMINILKYHPWYLKNEQKWENVTIEDSREHGGGLIVKLSGWDTPEIARQLTGKLIGVEKSQLPTLTENEYYWDDLIGLTVIDQHQQELGKIIYIIETGANDVLVVKNVKEEHAIPYLQNETILSVDLEKGEMHVKWEKL